MASSCYPIRAAGLALVGVASTQFGMAGALRQLRVSDFLPGPSLDLQW